MVPAPAAAAILPTFRFSQPVASGTIAGARRNAGLPLVALGASDLGLRRLLQTPLPQLRGSAGLRLAGPPGFAEIPCQAVLITGSPLRIIWALLRLWDRFALTFCNWEPIKGGQPDVHEFPCEQVSADRLAAAVVLLQHAVETRVLPRGDMVVRKALA